MTTTEQIKNYVDQSASFLAPLPPIYQFVASNPRAGLLHMHEKTAMRVFRELVAPRGLVTCEYQCPTLADLLDHHHRYFKVVPRINRKVIRYCGAYCDKTQAQWSMERDGGLLDTWRDLVKSDMSLPRKWKNFLASDLPRDPSEALAYLLDALGVDDDHVVRYLRRHLFQMPGWSSHLVWRQSQGKESAVTKYLVMRLFYELVLTEALLLRRYGLSKKPWSQLYPALGKAAIVLTQVDNKETTDGRDHTDAEVDFRDKLLGQLSRVQEDHGTVVRPSWQMINCIDAREERLRRAWEEVGQGRNKSFGVAGFFGVPARFIETGSHMELALCPLPVNPDRRVREVSDSTGFTSRQALKAFAIMMQKKLKGNPGSAFGFVDIVGLPYALILCARAFFPGMVQKWFQPKKQGCVEQSHTHLDLSEFPLPEKIAMAEGMLRSIGLTENFAPAVLLCGHESTSSNNPYAASLQCGACGGNTGRYSARMLADILNDKQVRVGLKCEGINVPEDTHFVGGVHNTTTDVVTLLGHRLPASHQGLLDRLKTDLCKASARVQSERLPLLSKGLIEQFNLPGARASDPANVVPEMGLYGADAIIVGERRLTEGLNLEGRTFLHSYNWRDDTTGAALAGIMGGAVIVASGIKEQYRTSALDNDLFGSGNKVTLNPYGGIGVMQGAFGDLKWGLTEQSVFVQNGSARDVPMRLLVVIEAPPQVVSKVIPENETVANLVRNDWIRLVVLDPVSRQFFEASGVDSWKELRIAA